MYTIKENKSDELIIKKSKFITYLFKINNVNEFSHYLKKVKDWHPDATHYCYAYRLNNLMKYSDDHEPTGTAGKPILDILLKKDLTNVLIIVVRYFGGTKLGTGPLLRAYRQASMQVIDNDNIIFAIKYITVQIKTCYTNKKMLDKLLKDALIKEIIFDQDITYIVDIAKDDLQELTEKKIDYVVL